MLDLALTYLPPLFQAIVVMVTSLYTLVQCGWSRLINKLIWVGCTGCCHPPPLIPPHNDR